MNRLICAAFSAFLLTGCYTVSVDYTPTAVLADALAAPTVRVEIVDARPEDQGLNDGVLIGQYRGDWGIPNGVENGTTGVMPATITAVTSDSLAAAGIRMDSGADAALVARVTQYWSDGMVGVGGWVTVEYSVLSAGGVAIWEAEIEGEGGAGGLFGNDEAKVELAIEEALVDLAAKARALFAEPAFRAAIGAGE